MCDGLNSCVVAQGRGKVISSGEAYANHGRQRGLNGIQRRQWKFELQWLADDTGLTIGVCYYPPGTSKWNKIEHRLFAFISQHWRGELLVSFETIVTLISTMTTKEGLKVYCQTDHHDYPTRIKVTYEEMKQIRLFRKSFHGEWNYDIKPHER
jgi:hypothetical protein